MNHWIILPAVIPALTAAFMLLVLRFQIESQRVVSIFAIILLLAVDLVLLVQSADGVPLVYRLGNWEAPFGIVLVIDRLNATLLTLTGVLALCVVVFATGGADRAGRHFHPLFLFQLLGINGAFLTGDIFNLFVFFEVMLIASYGLMLHGGGAERLKAGFQYVAINLVASTLFLIGAGLIYAATGTLNMADLAVKAGEIGAGDQAILKAGALLLFLVFATKASLVPLHWWLPSTYASTSAPAAAIFMIMTKVGAYAILRVYGMVFGVDAGPLANVAVPFVLPAAAITLFIGALGVLGSHRLKSLAAFSVVASMGTLLLALGTFTATGVSAALYYLVHSTLAGAALFLIAGLVADRRGEAGDRLLPAPAIRNDLMIGGFYLLAAIGMAGLPPLSGFIGKVMILDALRASLAWPWLWALVLATSLLLTIGFVRAGSAIFWGTLPVPPEDRGDALPSAVPQLLAISALLAMTALWTLFGGPAAEWLNDTARQALDRDGYVEAVLGAARGG